ncbi:MAG: hypothetical protein ACYDCQ_18025, partial [Dehalococcoidia bacterium]
GLDVTMGRVLRPLYVLFTNKWYADWLAEDGIVRGAVYNGFAYASDMFDSRVVDGIANGLGKATDLGGATLRRAQSGQFQEYGFVFGAGVAVIAIVLLVVSHG